MGVGSEFASDGAYRLAVGEVLGRLMASVDEIDADLDIELAAGGLKVVFEDTGDTFILSQQTPTHELWLSANMTAWHFRRTDGAWLERDTREPMLALLGRLFSEKLSVEIVL